MPILAPQNLNSFNYDNEQRISRLYINDDFNTYFLQIKKKKNKKNNKMLSDNILLNVKILVKKYEDKRKYNKIQYFFLY